MGMQVEVPILVDPRQYHGAAKQRIHEHLVLQTDRIVTLVKCDRPGVSSAWFGLLAMAVWNDSVEEPCN